MTSPLMPTYPDPSVTFVRGAGTELWDDEGRRYLDFLSGLAVTSLGHAHPAVAAAVAEQAATLLHVSNLFGTEPGSEVAATLDELLRLSGGWSIVLEYAALFPLAGLDNPELGLSAKPAQLLRLRLAYGF